MGVEYIDRDPIAAISTAQGQAGVAVIRMSGERVIPLFSACFRPAGKSEMRPREMRYGHVLSETGEVIDEALGVIFPAPKSFTREDVCEIQCHGGRVSAQRILNRVLELGARVAEPGEFMKRAYLNGRVDMSEAEAVMALIEAGSEAAARAAVKQIQGGVSRTIGGLRRELTDILALIEASDDFPEEIEEKAAAQDVLFRIVALINRLDEIADERAARMIREGVSVVLVGRPNVGKSSLMNALLKWDRAIVSDVPGTTRDVLTERLMIDGFAVELWDTAGQRAPGDAIELIGVERARRAEDEADIVLLVLDASRALEAEDRCWLQRADGRYVVLINKEDLAEIRTREADVRALVDAPVLSLSAATGEGVEGVFAEIARRIDGVQAQEQVLTIRRHIGLAKDARAALARAQAAIEAKDPLDMAAIDLWEALEALSSITGENAREDVIDHLFASFCVGK